MSQNRCAQSRCALEFLVTPTQFSVPFSTNVIVDADLSTNDPGLASLSQIADQARRTFPVDGVAISTIGLTAHANMEPLSWSPGDCPTGSGVTTKPLVLNDGQIIGLSDDVPIRGNPLESSKVKTSKRQ